MDLTDRPFKNMHALVTGASRGIGAAIAERLAEEGANLTLIGRNKSQLEEVAAKCREISQARVLVVKTDVLEIEQIKSAFRQAEKEIGAVDLLINNAGAVESKPFQKCDLKHWTQMIDLNLRSVFLCIQEVLPKMLERNFGRIVSISSTAGLKGYPYVASYAAAKHGIIGLTKSLALEVATTGITVNAVCPGFTDTSLLRDSVNIVSSKTGKSTKQIEKTFVKNVPQGRFVKPSEIASAVAWLCAREQSSITGQTITIDGGELA